MTTTTHTLDYNGLFPLHLDYDPKAQTLTIAMSDESNPSPRFRDNIYTLLHAINPNASGTTISKSSSEDGITFHPVPPTFKLLVDKEPFLTYQHNANDAPAITDHRPLTDSQTRSIGTHHRSKTYTYETGLNAEAYAELSALARSTITTDVHTHSSGQISARSMLDVARKHDAYYPIHLLQDIGIQTDRFKPEHIRTQKRIPFQPLEPQDLPNEVECVSLNALSDRDLRKLELHMSLRTDRQSSFTDAEYKAYRLRYPLAKNPDLLVDSLKAMAKESYDAGLRSVDLSFVGLDNPAILRQVHHAVWEIEHAAETHGFQLRFKHGIPRSGTVEQFKESLEKAKALLRSPYIMGIDILGYEINKTTAFAAPLEEFAIWMKQHRPDATLHVHAGENDKNPENVKEVLRLGIKHGIKVNIGHGLYGLDDEAIALAKILCADPKNPRLFIEANPASNIALNNIGDLRDMPFRKMLDNNIPFIVSSDSLGLYQTSPEQLGISLIHAGFKEKDFHTLKNWQDLLEDRQRKIRADKQHAIPGWATHDGREAFINGTVAALATIPKAKVPSSYRQSDEEVERFLKSEDVELIRNPRHLPDALRNRTPIAIVGASGSSWNRISPGHQREIAIAYDMLAHAVDPEQVYFVQGRNKAEGVNDAVNKAMKEVQQKEARAFLSAGLLTDPAPDTHTDYTHLSHLVRIKNALDVADTISNYTTAYNGTLIVAGGAAFTRDIILQGDRRMEKSGKGVLLVMKGPEGASTDKARFMDDSYLFREGKELLQRLHHIRPDIFRPEYRERLTESDLRTLWNNAAERVGTRYGSPDATQQQLTEILPPQHELKL